MGQLTQHDRDLGLEPITTIDDFVSPEAKVVAARFGLALDQLPHLLKIFHDYEVQIETRTAPQEVMASGPQALAACAVILYEQSVRERPFKFVLPGKDDIETELYDHVIGADSTFRGRKSAQNFAKLYEKKAHGLLNAPQPQLPSQTA